MQGVTVIESFSRAYTVPGVIYTVLAAAVLAVEVFLIVKNDWREGDWSDVLLAVILAVQIAACVLGAVIAFTPVECKRVKVDPSANY